MKYYFDKAVIFRLTLNKWGGGSLRYPCFKIENTPLISEKKALIVPNFCLNIPVKKPEFFPGEPFFLVFLMKYLSKCLSSTKLPLPWKISGCAPDLEDISAEIRVFLKRNHWESKFNKYLLKPYLVKKAL